MLKNGNKFTVLSTEQSELKSMEQPLQLGNEGVSQEESHRWGAPSSMYTCTDLQLTFHPSVAWLRVKQVLCSGSCHIVRGWVCSLTSAKLIPSKRKNRIFLGNVTEYSVYNVLFTMPRIPYQLLYVSGYKRERWTGTNPRWPRCWSLADKQQF